MRRAPFLSLFLLIFSSCGYHVGGGEHWTVSVPYVIGDQEGALTDALIATLSKTPNFRYVHGMNGDLLLRAKIVSCNDDRIGYKYDRDPKSGRRRDNVIGIENRRIVAVEIRIEETCSGKTILGPQVVQGFTDYDYVNQKSLQDLSFIDEKGKRVTSVAFSLGQLDSVGAAGVDANRPIYSDIAEKIVQGLLVSEENLNG